MSRAGSPASVANDIIMRIAGLVAAGDMAIGDRHRLRDVSNIGASRANDVIMRMTS